MTMVLNLRGGDGRRELSVAESSQLFAGLLALDADGDPAEHAAVRPLVDESSASWPAVLDRAIDPSPRGVIGLVSESPAEAAVIACDLASWAGISGRDIVIVDGSVETPVIGKALGEHGDEGLVDAVLFGVSPSIVSRRTLTRGVRVVTAGSRPLSVESLFATPELGRVLRELKADNVLMVVPRAHLIHAGRFVDVLVVVARDADALVALAREGREAGVARSVGVLLCEPEAAVETPAPDHPETAAAMATRDEESGPWLEEGGDAARAAAPERQEAAEVVVSPAVARRNEFVRPEPTNSPFISEVTSEPVAPSGTGKKRKLQFGFVGWLAIAAIIIIVALTVFDMTLRPTRLAWREAETTELGELQTAREEAGETGPEGSGSGVEMIPTGDDASGGDQIPEGGTPEVVVEPEAGESADDAPREGIEPAPSSGGASAMKGGDVPAQDGHSTWIGDAAGDGESAPSLQGTGGPYVVLLSSHRLRSAAEWDAGRAASRGLPAEVVQVELPDSGTWYRVALAGGQPTLASAREVLDIVRELGYEGAWLVRE